MRRLLAPGLALGLIVAVLYAVSASSEPIVGTRVPSVKAFNALDARVMDLEDKVAALEAAPVDPTPEPEPEPDPTEEPTPDPEPTEEPTTEPEPVDPASFPTRESVGPDVDPTVAYEGDCYFGADESGTVITGRVLDCDSAGGVRFAKDATGIVFRDSIIRGQMFST